MKRTWLLIIMIALGTAILGEFKIQPFGSVFRFGLGSMFFLLGVVYWRELPLRVLGLVSGLTTVLWRISLDVYKGQVFWDSLINHLPAFFYYLTLVFFLYNVRWWEKRDRPLQVGGLMGLADFAANLIEMLVRCGLDFSYISPERIWFIVVVATCRGLAVVLVANLLLQERFRITKVVAEEQFAERLFVGSNLHMEVFYLRKSMAQVETVMVRSHDLYKELKIKRPDPLAGTALEVAKEIHEIKKDLRRMEEGLNRLIAEVPAAEIMELKEILDLVAQANQSLAYSEGKDIDIEVKIEGEYVTERIYPLVSVLNNLVQNAVEAIEHEGQIKIEASIKGKTLFISVIDNGPGIAAEDRDLIFEPGFTSKFAQSGQPSTGIGLTHVRDMVKHLGGNIELKETEGKGATFSLHLPI